MPKTLLPLLLLILTCVAELAAQSENGTIRGTVRDPQAVLLPGVKITATNAKTKETYKASSNESGDYRLTVPPGTYEIDVELPGFSSVKLSNVTVKQNESTGLATLTLRISNDAVDIQRHVIPIPLAPPITQPSKRL
jgi:hypothetical protein